MTDPATQPKPMFRAPFRVRFRTLGPGLALAALMLVGGHAAQAQSMTDVAEICSDPMTTGPEKLPRLAAAGWVQGDQGDTDAIALLANAHIATFTAGMDDWAQRYNAIPQLADNLTNMIAGGTVTLWTMEDSILAVSIQTAPANAEHLGCYFASPARADTLDMIARYGEAETVPDQNLTILRFDETAFVTNPDREYRLYSSFSRHQTYPEFTHPDAYRLERVRQPDAQ